MQPALPFHDEPALPSTPPPAALAEPPALVFVRHRRARRYILRMLPDGTLRVTVPRWGSQRDARRFVEESREWVARQRAARQAEAAVVRRWCDGATVLVNGEPELLRVEPHEDGPRFWCGKTRVPVRGPLDPGDLEPHVSHWLRLRARRELPPALLALAGTHGLSVARVSIRDQRSRWGACSRRGSITLNWRLVQVPPAVREYVLLHELMHLRELNHSPRFWRLVAAVCPDYVQARHWLRRNGPQLF
jgi:predicted metal-dependent hydrolase